MCYEYFLCMDETLNLEHIFSMLRMIITQSISHGLVFVQCPCSKYYFCILTTMTELTSYNNHKFKCRAICDQACAEVLLSLAHISLGFQSVCNL